MKIRTHRFFPCGIILFKALVIAFVLAALTTTGSISSWAREKMPESNDLITCVYDLMMEGEDVGDITTTRPRLSGNPRHPCLTAISMVMEAPGFWDSHVATTTGEVVTDERGLLRFDHKITENDEKWRIFGDRQDQDLWCGVRRVMTEKEKDEEDLAAIGSLVIANTVPYAGTALTLLNLVGEEHDNQGDLQISFTDFDTTLFHLPIFLMQKAHGGKDLKVRVLDTMELKIETRFFENAGRKQIRAAGHVFDCRVFTAKTSDGRSTYWISEDEAGAFVIKAAGMDTDGPFEMILKKYDNLISVSRQY